MFAVNTTWQLDATGAYKDQQDYGGEVQKARYDNGIAPSRGPTLQSGLLLGALAVTAFLFTFDIFR